MESLSYFERKAIIYGSNLDDRSVSVLQALNDHIDGKGYGFPSIARLSNMTRIHPSTVRRRLHRLKHDAIVVVEPQHNGLHQTSNEFWINFRAPKLLARGKEFKSTRETTKRKTNKQQTLFDSLDLNDQADSQGASLVFTVVGADAHGAHQRLPPGATDAQGARKTRTVVGADSQVASLTVNTIQEHTHTKILGAQGAHTANLAESKLSVCVRLFNSFHQIYSNSDLVTETIDDKDELPLANRLIDEIGLPLVFEVLPKVVELTKRNKPDAWKRFWHSRTFWPEAVAAVRKLKADQIAADERAARMHNPRAAIAEADERKANEEERLDRIRPAWLALDANDRERRIASVRGGGVVQMSQDIAERCAMLRFAKENTPADS